MAWTFICCGGLLNGFNNFMIICSQHTVSGQVGFVMKKKFCHETFLTSSRGILIARNFSKEKKYSYVREWSNFCIGESSSDFFNIPTWNASLVAATQFRRGYVLSPSMLYCKAIWTYVDQILPNFDPLLPSSRQTWIFYIQSIYPLSRDPPWTFY